MPNGIWRLGLGAPLGILQKTGNLPFALNGRVCLNKRSVYRNTGMCIINK